jgi:hypothetical protein
LGDGKLESMDELQERQQRVLTAVCRSMAFLVSLAAGGPTCDRTPAEQDLLDRLRQVFEGKWQRPLQAEGGTSSKQPKSLTAVLKAGSPGMRCSAYDLVTSISTKCPDLLQGMVLHSKAIILSINDPDPSCHAAAIGMLQAYLKAFPAVWEEQGSKSAAQPFLDGLRSQLKHNFHGSASASAPAVPSLLLLMPCEVVAKNCSALLAAAWDGVKKAPLLVDKDALAAAVKVWQD